ncbi:MAG: GtrA family protein [Gammaproteobacteria bacterium]|nr:GtrA family protein [Gammaproteobacteria bacterium]
MSTARSFAAIAVATRYAAFAVLATVVNVATQLVAIALYEGGNELYVAMAGGTATGLVTKYLLDRRWIFGVRKEPLPGNAVRFAAYSTTGVLTTLLFWAVELGFAQLGDSVWLPITGACLGLSIGYTAKYHLDKRFVFARIRP